MQTTYLIQRLKKPHNVIINGKPVDNPFSFGGGFKNGGLSDKAMSILREIMSFDYMGSAEFEFGAVPAAFNFIAQCAAKNILTYGTVSVAKDCKVYYICSIEYGTEVPKTIQSLYTNEHKFRLKEPCELRRHFDMPENSYLRETVGWLELDNGYMFFTDEKMFKDVCKLFGIMENLKCG